MTWIDAAVTVLAFIIMGGLLVAAALGHIEANRDEE